MIIGIDETGDFDPRSNLLSFFVAVLLDQSGNSIQIKRKQFNDWLSTVPAAKINSKGEVKGSDLMDQDLLNFVEKVILSDPPVRVSYVQFRPSDNPEALVQKFKNIEVAKLERIVNETKAAGKLEMSAQYSQMLVWYRSRKINYQHYVKILLLRKLILKTLEKAIGFSIILELLGNDPTHNNLLNIQYKIDKDFITSDGPKLYWKEILRNAFRIEAEIPTLDVWEKTGHPFLDKYKAKGGHLNLKPIFEDSCDFYESESAFEVQMADIVGIIINRFRNQRPHNAKEAYEALWRRFPKADKPTEIVLNKDVLPPIPPTISGA